jgi:hypothetical protein
MNSVLPIPERKLTIATLASVSIVLLLMLVGYWKIQQDDSYIFYSYARNLASGHGYVFNAGERVNATTSPLYTILLALADLSVGTLPFVTLPLIGHLVGIVSLFFVCLFLTKSLKAERSWLVPYLSPLILLSLPLLPNAVGMETFISLMLGLLCLYYYGRGRPLAAALVCSLAVLARPDLLLLATVLTTYHLVRHRRLPSVRAVSVFLLPIVVWLLFSFLYFGDLLPSTLSAKLGQTESGRWGTGLIFFKGLWSTAVWRSAIVRDVTLAALLLGLGGFAARLKQWAVLRNPILHLILLWNLAYLVVYGTVLNPPAYPWYYTPLALGIAAAIALLVEAFARFLRSTKLLGMRTFLSAVYLILVLGSLVLPLKTVLGPVTAKFASYKTAAEWLNANTSPGSSVGANEIGVLRYYYANGPVIDGLGLVTPGVASHVRQRDYDWYIHQYRPDYLMFNHPPRPVLEAMVQDEWFQRDYVLRTVINVPERPVAIYERRAR